MPFSDDEFYSGYKRIRNQFRRYDPAALISQTIGYINGGENALERLKRQPWLGTLLIKWVLIDDNFDLPRRPPPNDKNFHRIYQGMFDLSMKTRELPEYEHHTLFLRTISHQQFRYQLPFSPADFGRQFDLFGDLPENHKLRKAFAERVGLDIPDFLELSLGLLVRFVTQTHLFVDPHWFSTLRLNDQEQKVARFLKDIALSLPQHRAKLRAGDFRRRRSDEYFEQTPFNDSPLLEVNGRYWLFHPTILFRSLEHFIHDQLRSLGAATFMNSFGTMFESYVAKVLGRTQLPTATEQELLRLGKRSGNLIDFVVHDSDAHIFIDAKGVTTSHQSMVSHRSSDVHSKVKVSAKAIEQALDVQAWLGQAGIERPEMKPQRENFLLVVTYKDLHLGNGTTFREAVAREHLDRFYVGNEATVGIPPENIYFMPIATFELLCEAVASRKIGLAEALRRARKDDDQPQTHKFDLLLHLQSWSFFDEVSQAVRSRCLAELERLAHKHRGV